MSDRLISADAFIAEMNDRIENAIKWGVNAIADRNDEIKLRAEQAVASFCEASLTAKKMPTVDAEPVRHGHWITEKEAEERDEIWLWGSCSVCGHCDWDCTESEDFNYCPNCGAKMDGGDS